MSQVLDASAALAYLHREPGFDVVRSCLDTATIGAVTWSEVAQKTARSGLDVEAARALLTEIGLQIVSFSTAQAETAAHLWQRTRPYGLSLADRACLALAVDRQATVLTADRVWADLDLDIDVQLVR